ncbi:MAG: DUF5615 family PIN-like protein, partial [Bacteroidota bacterium]|nr:DUF5615 family PIN-like protein [Bacteroidota bacterium]
MNLVADESVDFGIICRLREIGIEVISISEDFSGIKDSEVLKIAADYKYLLITEDKDFGELAYRLKLGINRSQYFSNRFLWRQKLNPT